MCGSSTLAIEAALLATNRFPGLFRNNYGFMHVEGYQKELYENEKQNLNAKIITVPGLKIIASDISSDAINISKINAAEAGVDKLISFDVCDFKQTYVPENGKGVVFFNPEYGERLGDEIDLQNTYAEIGNFMKQKCEGYIGYVFTGNFYLAKKIGLKPKRKIEFYNGKIDCRLLEYELYEGSRRK
jgi:putative N6-adenine-specific DNA methylase